MILTKIQKQFQIIFKKIKKFPDNSKTSAVIDDSCIVSFLINCTTTYQFASSLKVTNFALDLIKLAAIVTLTSLYVFFCVAQLNPSDLRYYSGLVKFIYI